MTSKRSLILLTALATVPLLQGFVLLSGPETARLPVNPQSPTVVFRLNSQGPELDKKDEFMGGIYASLSDAELYPILVQEAMDRWNQIDGSYVQLEYAMDDAAALDPEDQVFSIVEGSLEATAAASANPVVEDGIINDCDIKISSRKVSAKSLAYTLMHELGHCLGLGHNHTSYNAVMGYSRTSQSLYLASDDKAGILFLYPDADAPKPKEMISCGTTGRRIPPTSRLFMAFAMMIPISLAFWDWRSRLKKLRGQ